MKSRSGAPVWHNYNSERYLELQSYLRGLAKDELDERGQTSTTAGEDGTFARMPQLLKPGPYPWVIGSIDKGVLQIYMLFHVEVMKPLPDSIKIDFDDTQVVVQVKGDNDKEWTCCFQFVSADAPPEMGDPRVLTWPTWANKPMVDPRNDKLKVFMGFDEVAKGSEEFPGALKMPQPPGQEGETNVITFHEQGSEQII